MKNSNLLISAEMNHRINISPDKLIVGNLYSFNLEASSLNFQFFSLINFTDIFQTKPKFKKEEIEKIGVHYKDIIDPLTTESCCDLKILYMGDKRNINPNSNYLFIKSMLGFHFNTKKICSYYIFYDILNNKNIEILEKDFIDKEVRIYEAI